MPEGGIRVLGARGGQIDVWRETPSCLVTAQYGYLTGDMELVRSRRADPIAS